MSGEYVAVLQPVFCRRLDRVIGRYFVFAIFKKFMKTAHAKHHNKITDKDNPNMAQICSLNPPCFTAHIVAVADREYYLPTM
jgi:hypothetical protein